MPQKPAPHKIMNRDMAKSAYSARSQNFVLGITNWLLIALVLSLGFGQLLRFEIYVLPIYLHDLLIVIILTLLTLQGRTLKGEQQGISTNLGFKLIFIGLFMGWLRALTIFPLSSLLIPFLYTTRLLAYLALYLAVLKSKLKIPTSIFIYSGLVSLTIGLVQYFILPDMRIFQYLGWDDHLFRLTLPHFDPTFTAAMLSLYLLALPLSVFKTLSFILGIILSYSRSIWLSLIMSGLILVKNKKLLFLAIISAFILIISLPRKFGEGTNLLRSYSISSRFTHDLTLAQKVNWNFLIGQGYNTLPLVYQPDSEYPLHAHGFNNSYLEIISTMGIIGLLGWLLFMRTLYQNKHLRFALIFLCIGSIFNNLLLYPFTLLLLLLLAFRVPNES